MKIQGRPVGHSRGGREGGRRSYGEDTPGGPG